MRDHTDEIRALIEDENQRHTLLLAVLNDEQFMRGVLEARDREAAGETGEPWTAVKARLGLV